MHRDEKEVICGALSCVLNIATHQVGFQSTPEFAFPYLHTLTNGCSEDTSRTYLTT